jgi:hypothetical protein
MAQIFSLGPARPFDKNSLGFQEIQGRRRENFSSAEEKYL